MGLVGPRFIAVDRAVFLIDILCVLVWEQFPMGKRGRTDHTGAKKQAQAPSKIARSSSAVGAPSTVRTKKKGTKSQDRDLRR